nr:AtaL-like protein [Niveibacterium umoris]
MEPLADTLTREQVWAGLMWRVEDPCAFQPALVGCEILSRVGSQVERVLDFGNFRMRDTVHLDTERSVRFESEAEGARPAARLAVTIEEPGEGLMVLRFAYSTTLDDTSEGRDGEYAAYVKAAYHAADIDTVRLIRELAARSHRH